MQWAPSLFTTLYLEKKLLKSTSNEIFVPLKEYAARYWLEEKVGKRQLTQIKGGYNSSPKVMSLLTMRYISLVVDTSQIGCYVRSVYNSLGDNNLTPASNKTISFSYANTLL